MSLTLILARHGQTDWNVDKRYQGHQGGSLNDAGRSEAVSLAQALLQTECKIDEIISSTLSRSDQTAQIVGNILSVRVDSDPLLKETGFGSLEGLTFEEIVEEHGEVIIPHLTDYTYNYNFQPYGGESREVVVLRHNMLLEKIRRYLRSRGLKVIRHKTVLLVGHGRGLNNFLNDHVKEWGSQAPITTTGQFRIIENA